jgi:hypothetical protein
MVGFLTFTFVVKILQVTRSCWWRWFTIDIPPSSQNLVLLWQLFYLFCSSIVINTAMWQPEPLSRTESGRFGALKSDSTHHFFRNACTKSGSLRHFPCRVSWLPIITNLGSLSQIRLNEYQLKSISFNYNICGIKKNI